MDPRTLTVADVAAMPRFGGMTTEEDRLIGELMTDAPDIQQDGAEAADLIAKAEGISLVEAKAVIDGYGGALEEQAMGIAKRHEATIKRHQQVARQYGYRLMDATVTAFFQSRGGAGGEGIREWTVEDTQRLMRAVYLSAWELAQQEIEAERQPAPDVTEESIKKPSAARATSAKTGRKRSGS